MNKKDLKIFLDKKAVYYNKNFFIEHDPIQIPKLFSKKEDIEISAFLTATIAWGQRLSIINNARKLMELMDYEPYNFIINHQATDLKKFEKFVHRTFNYTDLLGFIAALKNIYINHGGLEKCFASKPTIKESISNCRKFFFEIEHLSRTQKHFSNPEKGASAKRINMFLRWMVRDGEVDFGIWKSISPSQLMCPLDVHTANVGRKLKLLQRKQNDWKAVEELTNNLRKFDRNDPVKYDFALFGLGAFEKY